MFRVQWSLFLTHYLHNVIKRIGLISLLTLMTLLSWAQNYDARIDSLRRAEDFAGCLTAVNEALEEVDDQHIYLVIKVEMLGLLGRFEDALETSELARQLPGTEVDNILLDCFTAQALVEVGRVDEAEAMYEEKITLKNIEDERVREAHFDWINTYGRIKWQVGQPFESARVINGGIELFSKFDEQEKLIPLYNNLGIIKWNLGEYDKALEMFELSLAGSTELYGKTHPKVARVTGNIGVVYYHMGDLGRAEEYYTLAHEMRLAAGQGDGLIEVDYHNNMGRISRDFEKYDDALDHFYKSKAILDGMGGQNIIRIGEVKQLIAGVMVLQDRFDEAITLLEETKAEQMDFDRQASSKISVLYHDISKAHLAAGDGEKTVEYGSGAIERFLATNSKNHPNVCTYYTTLSEGYRLNDEMEKALEAAELGIKSCLVEEGEISMDHNDYLHRPELITGAQNLAKCYTLIGEDQKALDAFRLGIDLLTDLRGATFYEASRLALAQKGQRLFSEAIAFGIDQDDMAFVFDCIERSKAFSLRLNTQIRSLSRTNPDLTGLLEEERNLFAQRAYLEAQLITPEVDQAEIRGKLFDLDSTIDSLKTGIGLKFPAYQQARSADVVSSLDEIQPKLVDRTYITYYFDAGTLIGFGMNQNEIITHVDSTFELSLIQSHQRALSDRDWILSEPQSADSLFFETNARLYEKFIEPFVSLIGLSESVVFSPYGDLSNVNFDLLPGMATDKKTYVDYPYLFAQKKVSYAWSASQLYSASNSADGRFSVWFSDPDGDLSFGQEESSRLTKITQGELLDMATEADFVERASDFSILHMIMHGKQSTDGSYGLNLIADSIYDGTLTSDEITLLELKARLVTMSACETGIGQSIAGETNNSLASAFSYAGVPAVVMSQWKVNDKSTAELMVDFYGGLFNGQSLPEALRDARLKFLADVEDPVLRHPHFWGAFVISGDPSPIAADSGWNWIVWLALIGVVVLLGIRFLVAKRTQ